MSDPLIVRTVALPISIDLGATFLFSITGAMAAIRRHYDPIGLFVLALACGLGGGLLRDGSRQWPDPRCPRARRAALIQALTVLCYCLIIWRGRIHTARLRLPRSPGTVCHLSDCDHVRVPSPGDPFRLEDQIGPAVASLMKMRPEFASNDRQGSLRSENSEPTNRQGTCRPYIRSTSKHLTDNTSPPWTS